MNIERLNKLADHLIIGQLGHKEFNITCWNLGANAPNSCGTSGCAIGECPIVFPEYWKFHITDPFLIDTVTNSSWQDATFFFEITEDEFDFLFTSELHDYASTVLSDDVTAKEVGLHIKEFIKHGGIYNYNKQ